MFKTAAIKERIQKGITAKTIIYDIEPLTVFSHEWHNPYPDKEIKYIIIKHESKKEGEIVLLGLTGIKK